MRSTTVLVNELERERASLARSGRLHWLHWVIVLLSGLLTIAAWYFSRSQVDEATKPSLLVKPPRLSSWFPSACERMKTRYGVASRRLKRAAAR